MSLPSALGLARANGRAAGRVPGSCRTFATSPAPSATLREIEQRLKSTRNIEKITKSMKMIAASKLTRAQRAMTVAKDYGLASSALFTHLSAADQAQAQDANKKILYVVVSSDKGMCGGIHSSVVKATKAALGPAPDPQSTQIVVLGDKSKAQLARAVPDALRLSFNQIGSNIPTFSDAAAVADTIAKADIAFDAVHIVYNRFLSVIAYEPAVAKVVSQNALVASPAYAAYEIDEESDLATDLAQFSLANAIYAALVEGHAAEISAKRNAMDNASKNATDMISSLQIKYNRGRQAIITNELIDIITGASAL